MNRLEYPPSSTWRVSLRLVVAWTIVLAGGLAMACSAPVFRYAFEHWSSDPYEAIVLHRGPMPDAAAALARRLRSGSGADGARPNLEMRAIDLTTDADGGALDLWKQSGSPSAPWLVVKPPGSKPATEALFSGPLNEETLDVVLDSPARQEIIRRLGDGESAVWVLLESGDRSKDDAAMKLLESRLEYLASVLELPKLDEQDIRNGLVSLPNDGLKLAFSTLRIRRDDPAERAFVPMLLATEPDLKDLKEPMVFPVFGQARVLYAIIGKGIKSEIIDRAASFLIGSCSCQVKEQNPGADLLINADWKKLLKDQSIGFQDLPQASEILRSMPEKVIISPTLISMETKAEDCCALMSWVKANRAVVAGALIVLLALAGRVMQKRFQKATS